MRKQRWGRAEALLAARRYNALARANGLTPTQMALAFCYTKWQVSSTIIGVTSVAQLDENLNAWGTTLSPEVLHGIDAIRWEIRDPALGAAAAGCDSGLVGCRQGTVRAPVRPCTPLYAPVRPCAPAAKGCRWQAVLISHNIKCYH